LKLTDSNDLHRTPGEGKEDSYDHAEADTIEQRVFDYSRLPWESSSTLGHRVSAGTRYVLRRRLAGRWSRLLEVNERGGRQ
jgi:hypothetical protein